MCVEVIKSDVCGSLLPFYTCLLDPIENSFIIDDKVKGKSCIALVLIHTYGCILIFKTLKCYIGNQEIQDPSS